MKTTEIIRFARREVPAGTECRPATPAEIAAIDPRAWRWATYTPLAVVFAGETRAVLVHPSAVAS